jgi:hypothetical protein
MGQLVGRTCVLCDQRIPSELDAGFCTACGAAVHTACSRTAVAAAPPGSCRGCGAPPAAVGAASRERERVEAARSQAGVAKVALGVLCVLGGLLATVACSGIALGAGTGRLVIASGAVFAGFGLVVQGLREYRSGRDAGPNRPGA